MVWKCPICNTENSDSEIFCKECGWGKESVTLPPPAPVPAPSTSYPRAALVQLDSLDRIDVTGGKILGRGPDCDVIIPSIYISRHHAKITFERGSYFIEDLHSVNGTIVNNKILQPRNGKLQLERGDLIKLGPIRFRVVITQSYSSDDS